MESTKVLFIHVTYMYILAIASSNISKIGATSHKASQQQKSVSVIVPDQASELLSVFGLELEEVIQ
ncbi:hypothetical protein LH29_14885 [Draconibacterium sediminis]|uniref:Uncharacterized protein n=1 Tax=Draconibacterium sediminis TaxID=1544798 RepID=A0A0D8JCH1_9BACT|nr:hypothetical protein LH29_14885 [Draconibacterium sediminis]